MTKELLDNELKEDNGGAALIKKGASIPIHDPRELVIAMAETGYKYGVDVKLIDNEPAVISAIYETKAEID